MEKFLTIRRLNDLPHGEVSYYKGTKRSSSHLDDEHLQKSMYIKQIDGNTNSSHCGHNSSHG